MADHPKVYISMPSGPEFERVAEVLRRFFETNGWNITGSISDLTPSSSVASVSMAVGREIENADLVIADLSGKSSNVLYEFGLAQGLRKNIMILLSTHSTEDVPKDISSFHMVLYDPDDPERLEKHLYSFASSAA